MNNLFSIFDPTTLPFFSLNWISLILPLFIYTSTLYLFKNSQEMFLNKMFLILNKEMKLLFASSFLPGLTLPLISIFWMILISNFLGLLPFIFTPTSHLIITLTLALPFWISINIYGWTKNTTHMLSHLIPLGTPNLLASFMVIVETISNIIRPITLSVRLAANMIAGHLILTLISNCFTTNLLLSWPIFIPEMLLLFLEMAVAIIQSYVFMILCTLYTTEIN